jgi:hypothetical protein
MPFRDRRDAGVRLADKLTRSDQSIETTSTHRRGLRTMENSELRDWLGDHQEFLHEISERFDTDERVTTKIALMVLNDFSDEEIYQDLGHEILVFDGQHSPLRHVPELLAEVRRTVAGG